MFKKIYEIVLETSKKTRVIFKGDRYDCMVYLDSILSMNDYKSYEYEVEGGFIAHAIINSKIPRTFYIREE